MDALIRCKLPARPEQQDADEPDAFYQRPKMSPCDIARTCCKFNIQGRGTFRYRNCRSSANIVFIGW